MKRLSPWQQEKQRTAKALRELPKCEWCGIKKGLGFSQEGSWLCPTCAALTLKAQRAQRERT